MPRTVVPFLFVITIARLGAASPAIVAADRTVGSSPPTGRVCSHGQNRCQVHVRTNRAGAIRPAAAPAGWGAADLQAAYEIDPTLGDATAVVAIVDAYGYANLEADLAAYRAQYGLPPCTQANGCLTIVNQYGAPTPLPPQAPANDDWTIETALDVDMASAACPLCAIVVVQAQDTADDNLDTAQFGAVGLGATVISNSWGRAQAVGEDLTAREPYFAHPGIATFVSSGDRGYNEGGLGPHYPSTSANVIAVGGTKLVHAANARGFAETAWTMGGSACSLSIAKPAYQIASPCPYRTATDLAAVADPDPGVAIYNAANGGWLVAGGTSAAAPLVASIYAATGHGDATGASVAQQPATTFHDVTSGANGTCGTIVCNTGAGWDGPTGYGTPNAAALAGGDTGGGSGDPGGGSGDPGMGGSGSGSGSGAPGDGALTAGCSAGGGGGAMLAIGMAVLAARRRRA